MSRFANIILALVGILVVTPILLLAIIWIKLVSSGNCLFTQMRVGLNGKPFRIIKLRTMDIDTGNTYTGSVTVEHDPRLFSGAEFIRSTKIDELPQLFNILGGTMAWVGPRPTVIEDYIRMNDEQRQRFLVRPGVTGLAQISGNTSLSWPERIKYDIEYIHRQSFLYDLKIMVGTAKLILFNRSKTYSAGDDEW